VAEILPLMFEKRTMSPYVKVLQSSIYERKLLSYTDWTFTFYCICRIWITGSFQTTKQNTYCILVTWL